jgi:cellulose synthase/poly-beta-1,6-N-acetylglucosamine synthase-like glycosyltransferase
MSLLSIPIIVILLIYSGLLFYLLIRVTYPAPRKTEAKNVTQPPGISIVVPFRNEAHNLPQLLSSLEAQLYQGKYEIILVNDSSTDCYDIIINRRRGKNNIKIIDSVFSADRHLTSKQQALDAGIKEAAYDWIACTDADMLLEPCWLASLALPAHEGADLVFGHTAIHCGNRATLFARFQRFQLETLFAVAYSFNRAGLTGSCMGNNLLISRKAYLAVGGFDAIGYSIVEDMALLTAFRRKRLRVVSSEPFSATAASFPAATFNTFFQQLLRWSQGGFPSNATLIFSGVLLTAQNIILVMALFGIMPVKVSLIAFGNLLLTCLFVAAAFRRIASNENPLLFLPYYALYLVESLFLSLLVLFKRPIIWKNRRIA